MDKTDEYIIDRLTWKAKRYNLPTSSSFFYNDLSPDVQQYLKIYTDEATCGQPVLFFTKSTNEWTLVCSRQIICNDNKQVFRINIQDIDKFKPTVFNNASTGQVIDIKENRKSEWHQVTVVDKQNNSYILHADKGNDLFALWNILLMAARLYD
ncbi:hypothetical protein QTN47_25405 [Danxiaibacter flavus]|uniref:Uncharacterized protein n=1 Tax=Danxiaibacter flavus TaxID=3049108 RepID=A0ABV3ZNZ2_9BACT|nr:hypothetical protein QNM32_25410 [Chitinophagaceae bacterium DXS]